MVHILSEIFLEYGDSIWVIPLAVFALVLVVVVISVMGIMAKYKKYSKIVSQGLIIICFCFAAFGVIMITRSEVSNINVRKAIRNEYTDAYFIKKAESKFISNDNVYYYTVKNRKIVVYTLQDSANANMRFIE